MDTSRERVISVSLNEHEWQEFTRRHPQPVSWLRERIQESIRPASGQAIGADVAISVPVSAAAAVNTTSATTR
jgi:hypothetical protein